MKTKKLDGFGSLGVQVYDFDLKTCSDDDLRQLGQIVIDQLVVTVAAENCTISPARLNHIAQVFGDPFGGTDTPQQAAAIVEQKRKDGSLTRVDLEVLKEMKNIRSGLEDYMGMIRVTGKRNEKGETLGMFADGELDWHSDRQGTGNFTPMILLYAQEGTVGTCTDFLQTADAYEKLTPEWKRTIEGLVAVHTYQSGKIAPGLNKVQDNIVRINMCPIDESEVPVACQSPGGRKGIRLTYNTIQRFKGYTQKESDEILFFLKDWFLKDEYSYRQNWNDGDLVFMDQTITVHRRPTKDCSKRVMIRQTCNFDHLLNKGTQGLQNVGLSEPGIFVNGKKITREEFVKKIRFST